jgi:hypothetical protein
MVRSVEIVNCAWCSCSFSIEVRKCNYANKRNRPMYCSKSCSYGSRKTGSFEECMVCKKPVWKTQSAKSRNIDNRVFCSRSCATVSNNSKYKTGQNHPNFTDGYGSYRERALKTLGTRCVRCGYDIEESMLDVHHMDGDRSNNKIDNLMVLCVWCHALKTRLGISMGG